MATEDISGSGPAESPLSPGILRGLSDRSYDKRKNAAGEIVELVKHLQEDNDTDRVCSIVAMLGQDFATSTNSNHRKGGLIGLAGCAIGLMGATKLYLDALLPPVLHCFDDPEARVRYYACEALYNISKVARGDVLYCFNQIFDGLCKLFADVDAEVKNAANLLDRLVKDIVTESENFDIEKFIPLLQKYIRRTNPYIRQLLVGWITVLDSVPDVHMVDWLPDFLDGLFHMLSDANREIRQAADAALRDFLQEIRDAEFVDLGPMVPILVAQGSSPEKLARQIAIDWITRFIKLGADRLVKDYSELLGAVMRGISDREGDIKQVAAQTNALLLKKVQETTAEIELRPLLEVLKAELVSGDVQTRLAALRWIKMLVRKLPKAMGAYVGDLLPALLRALSDPSDAVALLNLEVLARVMGDDGEFRRVLPAILQLFNGERRLLETRGALVVRRLAAMLDARAVYLELAAALQPTPPPAGEGAEGGGGGGAGAAGGGACWDLDFVGLMIQTLNLILLTAAELADLRDLLAQAFQPGAPPAAREVFRALYRCWCHHPAAALALCLLAQAYDLAAALARRFGQVEVTVGLLMQLDKLVQLLESPIFTHLRLQLLEVDAPGYPALVRALYGLLALLPQSRAYATLAARLEAGAALHRTLTTGPSAQTSGKGGGGGGGGKGGGGGGGLVADEAEREGYLREFDAVQAAHARARRRANERRLAQRAGGGGGGGGELTPDDLLGAQTGGGGGGGGGGGLSAAPSSEDLSASPRPIAGAIGGAGSRARRRASNPDLAEVLLALRAQDSRLGNLEATVAAVAQDVAEIKALLLRR